MTKLEQAEEILADRLELEWCPSCDGFHETDYKMTHRQTLETPEEGVYFCENCGEERG